jgi:hypothetical protein
MEPGPSLIADDGGHLPVVLRHLRHLGGAEVTQVTQKVAPPPPPDGWRGGAAHGKLGKHRWRKNQSLAAVPTSMKFRFLR